MFSIDENNKIKLTIGDTASFNCTIVDNEEKTVPPVEGDSLVMYIDSTDFEKEADITNNEFVFTITGDDMTGINTGVYMYRVVLNDVHTIIQDCFIDLLQGLQEEEPTPEPEPTPDPETDLDPDPEIVTPTEGSYAITFGNPICNVGDTITVKMRVAPEAASTMIRLNYTTEYLSMTGYSGGLGNDPDRVQYSNVSISINDYASEGTAIAQYEFTFRALKEGTGRVTIAEVVEITDGNGDPYSSQGAANGNSTITIREGF